jgi:LysM repeat protein
MKKLLLVLVVIALVLPIAAPAYGADTVYIVQPGDTLFRISLKFGVSQSAIMAANGLANANLIFAGQRLTIPGVGDSTGTGAGTGTGGAGTVYIVQPGDTLFRISLKFDVTQAAIMSANGLTNANLIFAGQRLTIPGTTVGPTPAPTAPPPPPGTSESIYIVQRGDTLFLISARFGVSQAAIIAANGLTNPNLIFVGQRLTIPSGGSVPPTPAPTSAPPASTPVPTGGTYTVKSGDTLWSISVKFGVTVEALKAANNLTSNFIFPGQILTIPGGGGGSPSPTATPIVGVSSFELGGQVSNFTAPDKMKFAGMAWVKRQVKWSPGLTAANSLITDAHNKGFKIVLSVTGNPADISGGANFDSYAAFVGELARLGADGIEVWNEMNIDREWPAGQINPTTYTDLLRRSYIQIKAKNSNTLVISGAPAPTGAEGAFGLDHVWNDNRYIAGMASAGAGNYLDCVGVHYNEGIISPTQSTGDPRDNYYTRYYSGMVNTYFSAFGNAKKLCFTELGYLSGEGYGALPANFGWAGDTSVAEQAQWLGEAVGTARSSGIVRLLVIFNVDFTTFIDDPQGGYAMIRPDSSCPACDMLHVVTGGR